MRGLEGLRAASLEPAVRASDPAGEILRRGLAVSSYNMLETFLEGRLRELTSFINQGHVHFADLPAKLQKSATRRTLEVANARVKRMSESDVRSFVAGVGESIAATDGPVNLSVFAWLWQGSNMSAHDYSDILNSFHVKKPWEAIPQLASRLRLPAPTVDAYTQLREFANERHSAAHDSSHHVSNVWIPHSVNLVTKFALIFDAFASVASLALRRADISYLEDHDWTAKQIGIRRIQQRSRDWAERTESGKSAFRVGPDQHAVTVGAASRCKEVDLLIVTNLNDEVIDWSIPSVG